MSAEALLPRTLSTEQLALRRLDSDAVDVRALYDYRSAFADSDALDWVAESAFETVWEAHEFVLDAEDRWREREGVRYLLTTDPPLDEVTDAETVVGTVDLSCEWDRRTASVRVTIRDGERRSGFATEAAEHALSLAFDRFDLDAVTLDHAVGNDPARAFAEHLVEAFGGQ